MIAALCTEMRDSVELANIMRSMSGARASDELADRLAQTICNKLERLPQVLTSDAKALMSALSESGYTQSGKESICRAIEASLSNTAMPTSGRAKRQRGCALGQSLTNVLNYLTQSDWDALTNHDFPLGNKVSVFRERFGVGLELQDPSEQTYKWITTALVMSHFTTFP